jgi:RES domain-containing protein
MFSSYPPDRENILGARWNPPQIPAIYTSVSKEIALAEAEYQISQEPLRLRAKRTIYTIQLELRKVLDLTDRKLLAKLGIDEEELKAEDQLQCRRVGAAVEWLGHDGLLVPSARFEGNNLVIFPNQQDSASYKFHVVQSEQA